MFVKTDQERLRLCARTSKEHEGWRLDQAAAALFPDFSRSRLSQWIKDGKLRLDDERRRPKDAVNAGCMLSINAPVEVKNTTQARALELDVRHEDDSLIIVNKAPGMVTHPAAGHTEDTLVNALLYHYPELEALPRAGLIHRLDKDTGGLLAIARTQAACHHLGSQFRDHTARREYTALCVGTLISGGIIDKPLGRSIKNRKKIAVLAEGRRAITHYAIQRRFTAHTLVLAKLETGRTHQVRAHMAAIGHGLVGDVLYAGRPRFPPACSPQLREALSGFRRQALHAVSLGLQHPESGKQLQWDSELPADFKSLLELLEREERA